MNVREVLPIRTATRRAVGRGDTARPAGTFLRVGERSWAVSMRPSVESRAIMSAPAVATLPCCYCPFTHAVQRDAAERLARLLGS